MGQRRSLSEADVAKLGLLYSCPEVEEEEEERCGVGPATRISGFAPVALVTLPMALALIVA